MALALGIILLPMTLLILAGVISRHGMVIYVVGLILGAGILYLQRAGVAEACAINQSECLGAGASQMLFSAGYALGALIGGTLLVRQSFQKRR